MSVLGGAISARLDRSTYSKYVQIKHCSTREGKDHQRATDISKAWWLRSGAARTQPQQSPPASHLHACILRSLTVSCGPGASVDGGGSRGYGTILSWPL